MMAYQVASRAARDTLFLTSYDIAMLPVVGAGTALLSIAAAIYAARRMSAQGPGRLVPAAFLASAVLTGLEWMLVLQSPRAGALLLFVHTAVFSPVLVSGYWSLLNETLDPWTTRKLIGRIAAFATIGVVLGGVLADRVTLYFGVAATLPLMILAHAWCAWSVRRIPGPARRKAARASPREADGASQGLRLLFELPHVQNLALIVLGCSISAALLDFAFKATAASVARNELHFMRIFLAQNVAVAIGMFAMQMSFARVARGSTGPMRAIGLLPATIVLGGVAAFFPTPGVVSVLRGIEAVLHGSVFRSGYEVLYASLPWARRRAIRTVIDVGFDRAGDALGAGLNLFVLLYLPFAATPALLGLGALVAAGTLIFVARVRHGHIDTLRARVRDPDGSRATLLSMPFALGGTGVPGGDVDPDLDAGRDQVIERAGSGEPVGRTGPGDARFEEPAAAAPTLPAPADRVLSTTVPATELVDALRSGDARRARAALAEGPLDPTLVPIVIRLMSFDDLAPAAGAALLPVARRNMGQMVDALLDAETPLETRLRLADLLGACPAPRAVEGLSRGLDDVRFVVRVRCGRALGRLIERDATLDPDRQLLFAAVRRESQFAHDAWRTHRALGPSGPVIDFLRERWERTYDHMFALLALALPSEPMSDALRALRSDDPMARGAALEYLACILPVEVRDPLWPLLETFPPWAQGGPGPN